MDNNVNTWNIYTGEPISKVAVKDTVLSLNWNHNGSLLGLTNKEKLVHVIDPRKNAIVASSKAHDSSKSQKMCFLDSNYLFSCGFNKSNERQVKLYDMRNFENAVQELKVDNQTGIMLPFYDSDIGLIFIPGRGEGNIKYYEFNNGNINYASEYRSSVPQKGIAMAPKRSMNYNKCEIDRLAKLTINTIEYLSFYVPKRNEGYDSNVYPLCVSGEVALNTDEWIAGENKEQIRKDITTIENIFAKTEVNFDKRGSLLLKNDFGSENSSPKKGNSEESEKRVKI